MGVFISHNIVGDQQDVLSLKPETVNRLIKCSTIHYTLYNNSKQIQYIVHCNVQCRLISGANISSIILSTFRSDKVAKYWYWLRVGLFFSLHYLSS